VIRHPKKSQKSSSVGEAGLKSETSATPDIELMNAVMPSLGRFGHDGVLLVGSTPFAKRGILYEGFRTFHGVDDPAALCWVSPTRLMNPSFSQAVIDAALAKDYAKNAAEYLARFRDDVSGFLTREAIDACVMPGVRERGPQAGIKYVGAVDPAGGGPDSYTLAIAHRVGDIMVLDAIRERKGSPEAATQEYAALKSYGIGTVTGDNYAGTWPKEAFARYGITYIKEDRPRTAIYLAVLPLINSQRVELLDGQPRMLVQFLNLVRTAGPSGRDVINHPERGGYHDDLSVAASLALMLASVAAQPMRFAPPPAGISRSEIYRQAEQDIFANNGVGLPYDSGDCSCPPGGWPAGETMSTTWNRACFRLRIPFWPVTITIGIAPSNAYAAPVVRFNAPGPSVVRQTPGLPVSRPCVAAMNAAACS
jgi:hypothetical protein